MNQFYVRAKELEQELLEIRRKIHSYGGVGFDIQATTDLVMTKLKEYGYEPEILASTGVVCTLGKGGKTILLRADMDALPIQEETGLPYACTNGTMHACGHDCHTAMLLTAAKMLKEQESSMSGTVKFMFQPAEEKATGAKAMIEAKILENPNVDTAFSMHMVLTYPKLNAGAIRYCKGATYASGDFFIIQIEGMGCHGSTPNKGVDPITIGAKIVTALQEVIAMEKPSADNAVISIGQFTAGSAPNVIPQTAIIKGSIRSSNPELRIYLKNRLIEISEKIADCFRGKANVEFDMEVPPLMGDLDFTEDVLRYLQEIVSDDQLHEVPMIMGGEDFAWISEKVPTVMIGLSGGSTEEGYLYSLHNPKMIVDEKVLPQGAAIYATVAQRWLSENSK